MYASDKENFSFSGFGGATFPFHVINHYLMFSPYLWKCPLSISSVHLAGPVQSLQVTVSDGLDLARSNLFFTVQTASDRFRSV